MLHLERKICLHIHVLITKSTEQLYNIDFGSQQIHLLISYGCLRSQGLGDKIHCPCSVQKCIQVNSLTKRWSFGNAHLKPHINFG